METPRKPLNKYWCSLFGTPLSVWYQKHIHKGRSFSFDVPPDHVISKDQSSLNFRCQCTQQKLQSICVVLTFDPQLKKNLNIFCKRQISIKLFYLYQRLQCRDNYFLLRYPLVRTGIKPIRLFRIMSIPTTFRLFRVLTSEVLGRRLPVFTLLLWQRQHFIVVDARFW
jgi:hypothetical protein